MAPSGMAWSDDGAIAGVVSCVNCEYPVALSTAFAIVAIGARSAMWAGGSLYLPFLSLLRFGVNGRNKFANLATTRHSSSVNFDPLCAVF
jgi:hypothetical protein